MMTYKPSFTIEIITRNLPSETEEYHCKLSVMITSTLADVWIRHLEHPERYHYLSPRGLTCAPVCFSSPASCIAASRCNIPRVEAGKNTSTVIPASRKKRRKGNPVVSDETVMYGYESSATLTTDRLHYKYRPVLSSKGRPKTKSKAVFRQKKRKSKIWS
jgi:hypothetical protein